MGWCFVALWVAGYIGYREILKRLDRIEEKQSMCQRSIEAVSKELFK